jgi:hypothetical protein
MCDKTVVINGVEYAPVKPNGNRCVLVLDRGWIYAGDVAEENGRIHLSRVVWVFSWNEIGLDGVIANPKSSKAKLRRMQNDLNIPAGAELFRIPVSAEWGL